MGLLRALPARRRRWRRHRPRTSVHICKEIARFARIAKPYLLEGRVLINGRNGERETESNRFATVRRIARRDMRFLWRRVPLGIGGLGPYLFQV